MSALWMLSMSVLIPPCLMGAHTSLQRLSLVLVCVTAASLLAGCDQLGIETPQKATERQVADARAVGSACRHALRAIEDCYTLNPKAEKASVFAGWREMDEYMRENKLEGVAPVVPRPAPAASKPAPRKAAEDDEDADLQVDKAGKGKSAGH
jgi:hypothetical protein